jgi:long-chain-fatty-acyl-CoA reductase
MTDYTLPIIVAGKRIEASSGCYRFEYQGGTTVVLPEPPPEAAAQIVGTSRAALRDTSIDDLTIFFDEVRQHWTDPANRWRKAALALGPHVTGYASSMIVSDVEYLGRTLDRAKQYDFIATDLGDPSLLDEWRPAQAIYHRCWPKGLIAHIMVGNVPLAGLFALYRSLITKNVTVAKLPRRDVVSALCFANCIYDVDPEHPVSGALSTLYWEPESKFEDAILSAADVVSVWGRGETVEAIKRRVRHGVDVIEFGPKRSLGIVRECGGDIADMATRLASDVAIYDQEACFSCQELFCMTDTAPLAEALADALDRYEQVIPRRELGLDQDAHVQRARIEALTNGWRVLQSKNTEWTVVVTDGPMRLPEHPLARFVYIHPVAELADVLGYIDRDVQTVTIAPWTEDFGIADAITAAGADRLVPPGQMTRFRAGLSHDGFHPMSRMVRWGAMERHNSFKYRYAPGNIEELEARRYAILDGVISRREHKTPDASTVVAAPAQ